MFKKRQKKDKVILDEEVFDKKTEEKEQNFSVPLNKNSKQIKKQDNNENLIKVKDRKKTTGVDPNTLIKLVGQVEGKDGQGQQKDVNDMVGLIETKYLKTSNQGDEDQLLNNFINKKMAAGSEKMGQQNEKEDDCRVGQMVFKNQQEKEEYLLKLEKEREEQYNQEQGKVKKESTEINMKKYAEKSDNFMSSGISTSWQSGIMEVNISLEQKAQNMAKMEEIRRKQLLKGIIKEEDFLQKIKREKEEQQIVRNTTKTNKLKEEKELQEFEERFFKQGRAHRNQNKQNAQYNKSIENC